MRESVVFFPLRLAPIRPLLSNLDENGIVTYADGVSNQQANYSFDGEYLLIEGARLARYYLGEVVIDESDTSVFADPAFDLYRYSYYNFLGTITDDQRRVSPCKTKRYARGVL